MQAKVINLRRARKGKARDADHRQADANAARHGQPKAQRLLGAARKDLDQRRLDGHQRDDADQPDDQ